MNVTNIFELCSLLVHEIVLKVYPKQKYVESRRKGKRQTYESSYRPNYIILIVEYVAMLIG